MPAGSVGPRRERLSPAARAAFCAFVLLGAGLSLGRVAEAQEEEPPATPPAAAAPPTASTDHPADRSLDLGGMVIELRRIPRGNFSQGSATNEPGHEKDEEPQRPVTITHDFFLGKTPVTRGQFAKFVADTRYVSDAEKGQLGGSGWDGKTLVQKKDYTWRNPGFVQTDDHPVVMISYADANAFVGWASRKSGKRVRLPTEAEWEYAARGGTTTAWYGGKTEEDAILTGWFKPNAGNGTRPVAQRKANPYGLFDMAGDVFEWCRDVYAPYGRDAAMDPETQAVTGTEPERRVLRGGSWLRDPKRGRSAARHRNAPASRNADNGFRLLVTEDDVLGPGLGGATDFAPGSPLGLSGSGASASPSGAVPDASGRRPGAAAGDSFGWTLIAAPLAAAAMVMAWMLGRRRARALPEAEPHDTHGIMTRAVDDGFWLRAPDVAPSSRVRYRCFVEGATVTDFVPVESGVETFVYTGKRPSAIEIVEVFVAPTPGYRTSDRPPPPKPLAKPPVPQAPSSRPPPLPARASQTARAQAAIVAASSLPKVIIQSSGKARAAMPAIIDDQLGDVSPGDEPSPPSSGAKDPLGSSAMAAGLLASQMSGSPDGPPAPASAPPPAPPSAPAPASAPPPAPPSAPAPVSAPPPAPPSAPAPIVVEPTPFLGFPRAY